MKEILKFLKQNQGHPIFIEDLQQAFPSINLQQELSSLIKGGLIYPYDEGYYLTTYGDSIIQGKRVNPYEKLRKTQQGVTLQNRKDQKIWDAWVNNFIGFLDHFAKNHPELFLLMRNVGLVAKKDIGNYHDIDQFTEDVHAVFNKFDFSLPDLLYKSESNYTVPEFLASVEHAIAESVTRLHAYSPRHSNLFASSKEYRSVYDKVYTFLNNPDLTEFFEKLNLHKNGTFVKKDKFYNEIIKNIKNTYNIKNTNLISVSLDQLGNIISNFLRKHNNFIFYEGDHPADIINRLKTFLKTRKDNVQIFEEFKLTCIPDLFISIIQSLFQNEDYHEVDFSFLSLYGDSISINNCNFNKSNFNDSHFGNCSIENCNFQDVNFRGSNFSNVTSFKNNNIENADFKGSILSSEIDVDINVGNPINFVSLKLSQKEMIERGFKDDESFDHSGMNLDKNAPGRGIEIKGESWIRFIQASPTTPFPSKLYDLFNFHKVPLQRLLGWIGGKYDKNSQTLYITKVRSDLLQRSFELNNYFLDKIKEKGKEDFHKGAPLKDLREFTKYRKDLENYFRGWPKVFMNQAVREAKNREAKFIMIPVDKSSPHRVYDSLIHDTTEEGEVSTYPYEIRDGWYIIPVDRIEKFASFNKLSWKIMSDAYYELESILRKYNYSFHRVNDNIVIDHKGSVDLNNLTQLPENIVFNNEGFINLDNLTQLPENIVFNNKGHVDLYSLTQLPDNTVFNNEGYVYLDYITYLPENTVFNNKGNVYLNSLTQLPENKEQIFKNDGKVYYNNENEYYSRTGKLSWIIREAAEVLWDDCVLEAFWELIPEQFDSYVGREWKGLPENIKDTFRRVIETKEIENVINTFNLIMKGSKTLSWVEEEDFEDEDPQVEPMQEENILNKLHFNYKRDKEHLINQYLEDLYKAKKEKDSNKINTIKERLDELVSLGSKISWKEPPFPPNEDIQHKVFENLNKDIEETNRFADAYDEQTYEGVFPLRLEEVMSIKNKLREHEIDYNGLEFISFFVAKRNTFYGTQYDLIGVDDNGEYTILSAGFASSYKEVLEKTSSNKISWKEPPIEIGSIWKNMEEDKFYYIKGITGNYAIVYGLYNEEDGIHLSNIIDEYNYHGEFKKPLNIFNHYLLVGDLNSLINSGVKKLSWKIMSDAYYELEETLHKNNYSFHRVNDNIVIDHKGSVDLFNLTQLPDNVIFNNKGDVNLFHLSQLPENTVFNNKGDVYLNNITQLPENTVFNNKGDVYLSSLTQLPENTVFNNKGNVYLNNITQLPENTVFNNKGYVDLDNLTQLPENKEQIFKNDGKVYYNNRKNVYDFRTKKLSWQDIREVVNDKEWQELRKSFINTWKRTPEENIKKLRDYLGDMKDPLKLRRVHNYLTGSGFRIGVISHPEITKLLEEVREKRKENKKLSWKEPTTIHQDLMNEAYEIWEKNKEWSDWEFIEKLEGTIHQYAVILGNLNYQVENGGWIQWWSNNLGPRDWNALLKILPQINTPSALQVLKILKKAVTILKKLDEREYGGNVLHDKLDELNDLYFEINKQFMEDVDKFLLNMSGNRYLVISNQTYDVVDSQFREPEDTNFVIPYTDNELKRTNPPRYDKRKDIYQNVNENLRDSDVSSRFDQTSLTSGANYNKLSWKIMSDVYYELEQTLHDKNYSFHRVNDNIIIDHKGPLYLYNLTQLPENTVFNNEGDVDLSNLTQLPENTVFNNKGPLYLLSLTQLPENTVFNNKGYVNLYSLTQLPDNVVFNNEGYVYFYSLTQLPSNKEQIFRNDGIVMYDGDTKTYDPKIKSLSFNKTSVDINDWLETGIPFVYKRDSRKLYVGKRGQSHGEMGKELYDHGLKFTLYSHNYPYYPSDEEFLLGRVNSTKTKVGFYAKEEDGQINDCLFDLLQNKVITKDTLVYLDEAYSYNEEGKSVREIFSSLPNAEEIVEYNISPLNEMNLYPSKRKDNYDYKVRNTKGDEEMIFEKGLHQTIDRPETSRDIVPYGSKLSWIEKKPFDEYVVESFKELNIPLYLKDSFYRDLIFNEDRFNLSKLLVDGTYDAIKRLVKTWGNSKNLSFKQASPESYTDKSDINGEFRNLNDWHWEDKNLPFLKDEFPGEDDPYYKKDPRVFQELDEEQGYAYNGVQASQKLSWQFASDAYYELEDVLREENYSFHKEGDNIVIDEKGFLDLFELTQLPENTVFNNKGSVDLSSLTQLPNNTVFNNKGDVYLFNLTQLPNDIIFNNKGFVNLGNLTQLPDNKEQIFKNDGIVIYDDERKVYDPEKHKV